VRDSDPGPVEHRSASQCCRAAGLGWLRRAVIWDMFTIDADRRLAGGGEDRGCLQKALREGVREVRTPHSL